MCLLWDRTFISAYVISTVKLSIQLCDKWRKKNSERNSCESYNQTLFQRILDNIKFTKESSHHIRFKSNRHVRASSLFWSKKNPSLSLTWLHKCWNLWCYCHYNHVTYVSVIYMNVQFKMLKVVTKYLLSWYQAYTGITLRHIKLI